MLFSCQTSLALRSVERYAPLLARNIAAQGSKSSRLDFQLQTGVNWKDGGADRFRTGDLMLAKHALSQLSYSPMMFIKVWWAWVESNYRPHPYQGCALAS